MHEHQCNWPKGWLVDEVLEVEVRREVLLVVLLLEKTLLLLLLLLLEPASLVDRHDVVLEVMLEVAPMKLESEALEEMSRRHQKLEMRFQG